MPFQDLLRAFIFWFSGSFPRLVLVKNTPRRSQQGGRAGAGGQIWLISTAASSLLFFTQITQKYPTFRFLHWRCLWTVTERPLDHGMSYISWKLWPTAFRLRFPKWICPRCIFARLTHLANFLILFPQTPLFRLNSSLLCNQSLVLNNDSGNGGWGKMRMTPDFWRFAKLPRRTVLWLIQPGIPFSPHPKPSGTCKPIRNQPPPP